MEIAELKDKILSGGLDGAFSLLYSSRPGGIGHARERCADLLGRFAGKFGGNSGVRLFSSPGRAEICGNHTDHNYGTVVSATVDLDMLAAAADNGSRVIRVCSDGFGEAEINLDDLEKKPEEQMRGIALLRGICSEFIYRGYGIGGFDAYIISDVPSGMGLSSSACIEVLFCSIISGLFCEGMVSPIDMAYISRYAENEYYGKPSGMMDQLTCAMGGFLKLDFANPASPDIYSIDTPIEAMGLDMVAINFGVDHSSTVGKYAAVHDDMFRAAEFCGAKYLREVTRERFEDHIDAMRSVLGDNITLRAIHFFNENDRSVELVRVMRRNDREGFLRIISDSGRSSFAYLKNVTEVRDEASQQITTAFALAEYYAQGRGAFRVHGGGFSGSLIGFIDKELTEDFIISMERHLGSGVCTILNMRPLGGCELSITD